MFIIFSLIVVVGLIWFLGPREPFSKTVTFNATSLGDDLEAYVKAQEDRFSDIREGTEKKIVWADPDEKRQTELAFVFLHGFTAPRREIDPVPERLAKAFKANLFLSRLKGHGRTPEAMAEASADAWVNDAAEAVAIGSRLGKKVIVISVSTGGSIITWLHANRPEWAERIAGHILVSPNFEIADPLGFVLTWPFARQIVPAAIGSMRGKSSGSGSIDAIWTTPHATVSLMPMAKMVEQAVSSDMSEIKAPALFVYSPNDKTVVPAKTLAIKANWGGETDEFVVEKSGHRNDHVIIGDILSPQTTESAILALKTWISRNF